MKQPFISFMQNCSLKTKLQWPELCFLRMPVNEDWKTQIQHICHSVLTVDHGYWTHLSCWQQWGQVRTLQSDNKQEVFLELCFYEYISSNAALFCNRCFFLNIICDNLWNFSLLEKNGCGQYSLWLIVWRCGSRMKRNQWTC